MYAKWIPITLYELYNFLALFVATGLNGRPYLKDYWSQNNIYYTRWYHKMMSRERYKAIYHTMLHAGGIDETNAQEKIKPFLNKLATNFQAAYYPYQDVSIDEMVIQCNSII